MPRNTDDGDLIVHPVPETDLHVVIRAPLVTRLFGRKFSLIEEHNRIFEDKGSVILGKAGRVSCSKTWQLLRNAILGGRSAKAYIVHKERGTFTAYSSKIKMPIVGNIDLEKEDRIPRYYKDLDVDFSYWLELASELVRDDLSNLYLVSNGRPLLQVLSECRTSTMMVRDSSPPPAG